MQTPWDRLEAWHDQPHRVTGIKMREALALLLEKERQRSRCNRYHQLSDQHYIADAKLRAVHHQLYGTEPAPIEQQMIQNATVLRKRIKRSGWTKRLSYYKFLDANYPEYVTRFESMPFFKKFTRHYHAEKEEAKARHKAQARRRAKKG